MFEGLQSQANFMNAYAENLAKAKEMGLSGGLLAMLSDGSNESAAYLEAIVKGGADKIGDLNTAFAGVEDGKDAFASTVAEMETDFATKMGELETQLEATITEMDKSADAATAGAATVQAFADAALLTMPAVQAAFQSVANQAKAALKINISADGDGINAYASGTTAAERGFALVGEEGPELVWFNGGEQVANAEQTAAIAQANQVTPEPVATAVSTTNNSSPVYNVTVSPQYTINGSTDSSEMTSIFDGNTQQLREMVEDVLSDIDADRERMVYTR